MLKVRIKVEAKLKHYADIHGHIHHLGQGYSITFFEGPDLKDMNCHL